MSRLPARPDEIGPVAPRPSRPPSPWLMAALLALVAALALPKPGPFPYSFEKNGSWRYADLRAPFDFEVLRPEAEAAANLARVDAEAAPYFLFDVEVGRRQRRVFQQGFEEQVKKSRNDAGYAELVANQAAYLNFSLSMLDALFAQGIVAADTQLRPGSPIFLVKNERESRVGFGSLLTLDGANDWLTDTLPFSKLASPELLLPIFEGAVRPNVFRDDSLARASLAAKRKAAVFSGVSVKKGELVIARGQKIDGGAYLKLASLASAHDGSNRNFQLLGQLVLASLAALALALLVLVWFPEKWDDRRQPMLIFGSVLVIVLVFSGLARVGPSWAMLAPMLFLLFFLHQFFQKDLVWMAYLLAVLLTGLALEWGFGWCVVQFAGGFTLLLFPRRVISWRGRLIVAGTTTGVMTAALLGVILAGKFARHAPLVESVLCLWGGALLALLAFPTANFFKKEMRRDGLLPEATGDGPGQATD